MSPDLERRLVVFAGGIGENSPVVRVGICAGLGFLGISFDRCRNFRGSPLLSTTGGRVAVRVIRTDEAQLIARRLPCARSRRGVTV